MKKTLLILNLFIGVHLFAQEVILSFLPEGGVYEKETVVEMDAGEGASIYYTTDGSYPSSASTPYRGPITVSGVKAFRAVAYRNGKRSKVVTQTFVCDRPYDLAVISITTNPENLWDFSTGIYEKGCCADTIEPYLGANFWKDWEKPANIEMYDEQGKMCFNQNVGINIFGGFSRMLPQKSIAIFARSKYGENRIRYPIFEQRSEDKYKSFILRNSGGDFLRTHLRDAFMTQLAKPSGLAIQEYRPAVVFINGEYWGIQNLREKISEHYLKSNFDVDKNNVDILRHNGVKRHGYSTNYKKLLAFLGSKDLAKKEVLEALKTFMDVDDYISYNIAEVYSDNRDAGGNIRYWRERNDSAKWRWVYYDLDLGLGNNNPKGYKRNTLYKFTNANTEAWPDPAWSTFIIRTLLKNKEVEHQYINTFADHLNTIYHPDTAKKLWLKMVERIEPEMEYHQKRWGSSYKNWKHHCGVVEKFIALRPFYIRQHIMQKFKLEDTVNISIQHPGQNQCDIYFSSLKIDADYSGIYFKDVPIKITVVPHHDYEFVGWEDGENNLKEKIIKPGGDLKLVPILKPKSPSAFKDSVIINEISAFQLEQDSTGDWIEIYNRSGIEIDLSKWVFTDKSYDKGWGVPPGIKVPSKSYLVLTQDEGKFRSYYPADSIISVGGFGFGLSSKGECLKIYDAAGFMVDSVTYSPFNTLSDTSYSLALAYPDSLDNKTFNSEKPSPSYLNQTYKETLQNEANKAYWTKVLYLGGGGFFFILISGYMWFRSSRNKKKG